MIGHRPMTVRIVSGLLLAGMVVAACTPGAAPGAGGAGGAQGKPSGKPEASAISVGTSPVVKELFSPVLSYSGNVQARGAVNIVPKISARLERLYADVGDEVKANDVIAELDHLQLDAQVTQAEAGVTAAVAKLEQAQASSKQEDVDAAKAVVDQALSKLEQARAGGRPEDIAAARAAASQAQAKAEQAARGVRDEDRMNLQAAVDQAEATQDQTRAQLSSAQTALAESRYRLEQARAGMGGTGTRLEDISQAEATLATNRSKLEALRHPRPQDIAIAQADVDKAKADQDTAEKERDQCGKLKITTTKVNADGTTDKSSSQNSCPSAQKDTLDTKIDSAKAVVRQKQAALDKVKNPSPYDVQQAEQAVATAEANLQKLRYGGTTDLATLELNLAKAQSEVDRLQATLDANTGALMAAQAKLDAGVNPDPADVRAAAAAADQARANVARTANPDPFVVSQAQAAFDQAQAQLGSRLRPFTEQDIRVAASAVDQAAAALQVAKVQAAEAIIRAPFDATVSQKLLNPGALAAPQTPILALVSKDVEVIVQVEEARIGMVKRGQEAALTVSAFPGKVFPALIQSVSPAADPKSRTFAVRIVPSVQDGTLRDGMFSQVSVTGVGQEALLVPNDAVVARTGRTLVFAVVNDRVQAREVKLGDTDGKRTAVIDGKLNPGEQLVVTNPDALIDGAPVVIEQRDLPPGGRSLTPSGGPALPGVQPPAGSGLPAPSGPGGQAPGQVPAGPGGQQVPTGPGGAAVTVPGQPGQAPGQAPAGTGR
jgi:RND family efflux transporter MFP subunit